ncbi:DUF5327 family protein [Salibacterium sp. K-3]
MYISARTVVEKMEEEMMELADRLEYDDEDAVKNHARVIKSYCDMLTGEQEHTKPKTAGKKSSADFFNETKAPLSSPSSSSDAADIPASEGNLLEF